jgi:hypothetical protein
VKKNIDITISEIDSGKEKRLEEIYGTYSKHIIKSQKQHSRHGKSCLPVARKEQSNTKNKKTEIKGVSLFKGYDINGNVSSMNEIKDYSTVKKAENAGYVPNTKTRITNPDEDVKIEELPIYNFPSRLPSDLPVYARPAPAGLAALAAFSPRSYQYT